MGNAIDNTLDRLFRNSAATMALRAREGNTFVQPPVQPEAPPAPVGTVSIPQGEPVDLLSMVRSMSPGEVTRETIPAPSPGEVTRETDISQRGRALRELETLFLGIRNSLEPMTPDAQIAAMNRIQEAVAPKTPLTPTERVGELVRLVSAGALPSAAKGLGELGPAVAKSAKSGTLREIATSERGTIGKEPPKVP